MAAATTIGNSSMYPLSSLDDDRYNTHYKVSLKGNQPFSRVEKLTGLGLMNIFRTAQEVQTALQGDQNASAIASVRSIHNAAGTGVTHANATLTVKRPQGQAIDGVKLNAVNASQDEPALKIYKLITVTLPDTASSVHVKVMSASGNTVPVPVPVLDLDLSPAFPTEYKDQLMKPEVAIMYQQYVVMCVCDVLSEYVKLYAASTSEPTPQAVTPLVERLKNKLTELVVSKEDIKTLDMLFVKVGR